MTLARERFQEWLRDYGDAWEKRDPEAAAALFSDDALYYWTPFEEPKRGKEEIATAWRKATSCQRNVKFLYDVLAVIGTTGIARWHASFERNSTARPVELDGTLMAEFAGDSRCRVFREWWQSTEA